MAGMPILAAAIANVDDVHKRNLGALIGLAKDLRQPAKFNGQSRKYVPFDQKPENELDPELTPIQLKASEMFTRALDLHRSLWNGAAVRDFSNMTAVASVVVDDVTLVQDAPVPFLLYLEQRLKELLELVSAMPVRDLAEVWTYDADQDFYRGRETMSHRTAKVRKVLTLVPPTEQHPGQAVPYEETEPVGRFTTTKFTAAWAPTTKRAVEDRIVRVLDAVKRARVEANRSAAADVAPAQAILDYIWPASLAQQV